ncbi:putative small GTPase [Trypanosoma conorhini]|uniref:Putative small GTPase n=1 Tax=Trypanosoma conorhini TaxID=83891 RepID=A0A3R7NRL6_9TRYP|nr:putative small GTPase [Trypanosoma conorhini]RNF25983.1 putative small GTPase [Trypanosoma conorhini]
MASELLSLPKVLLLGLRKSGKSSIQKVVFEGMQPHDSVNLATTVQPDKSRVHSNDFVNFEVWDFPGQTDPFDPHTTGPFDVEQLLENCGAIVFVMDCRELIEDSRARLIDTVCAAYRYNPELSVEVFIHKVDALSEDHQADLLASLQRHVELEAKQRLESAAPLRVNFNLTSIYDHSVFQAFSLVVQKLIKPQSPYITELLQMLNSNSNVDLSYLFLSRSKIFLAVDERSRAKLRTYDLCSDAIEVMMKMSQIYAPCTRDRRENGHDPTTAASTAAAAAANGVENGNRVESVEAAVAAGANAVIKLSSDDYIYVKELPNSLTLVLMAQKECFQSRALIDYNIAVFYKAACDIFNAVAARP